MNRRGGTTCYAWSCNPKQLPIQSLVHQKVEEEGGIEPLDPKMELEA